jgi:hypothetical protein
LANDTLISEGFSTAGTWMGWISRDKSNAFASPFRVLLRRSHESREAIPESPKWPLIYQVMKTFDTRH